MHTLTFTNHSTPKSNRFEGGGQEDERSDDKNSRKRSQRKSNRKPHKREDPEPPTTATLATTKTTTVTATRYSPTSHTKAYMPSWTATSLTHSPWTTTQREKSDKICSKQFNHLKQHIGYYLSTSFVAVSASENNSSVLELLPPGWLSKQNNVSKEC